MSFILVPKYGDDVQVNGWNWRPTLALLRAEGLLSDETFERMESQGCGGYANEGLACRFADAVETKLGAMQPGDRLLADLTVTAKPKVIQVITPETNLEEVNASDFYAATYEWLETFASFCRRSGGFEVC